MARRCKECQCGLCKFFKQDRVSTEIGICEKHKLFRTVKHGCGDYERKYEITKW